MKVLDHQEKTDLENFLNQILTHLEQQSSLIKECQTAIDRMESRLRVLEARPRTPIINHPWIPRPSTFSNTTPGEYASSYRAG